MSYCVQASLVRNYGWIVIEALDFGSWRIPVVSAFVYAEPGRKLFVEMCVS